VLYENAMLPAHIAIIADDDKDVNLILSATLKLKKFDVHKTYSAEECLDKLKELKGKVDVIFVNGKIAADRAAMLIVRLRELILISRYV
jgi:two-component SAPR family response regulator